jgi:ActR/RegA family two-component response regulator
MQTAPRVARILIVDDDEGTVDTLRIALRLAGFDVLTAASGLDGVTLARRVDIDWALVDLRLPDISGLDVLRALTRELDRAHFILMSAWLTITTAVQAMRLGAYDVLEKPVTIEALLAVFGRATAEPERSAAPVNGRAVTLEHNSVADRLAAYVIKGCGARDDLKTLAHWAHESAVSYSTLCEICRLNGIRPLDARDFVRVLRAVHRALSAGCAPEVFLAIGDRRTLRVLSARAGIQLESEVSADMMLEFVARQQFVPDRAEILQTIRATIARWIATQSVGKLPA